MISINYIRKIFKEHITLVLFAFLLIGALQYLMVMLVEQMDILSLAQSFTSRLPSQMQQIFGEDILAKFSVAGAMAFGYTHPFVLVMLSILAILPASRHISGEAESGTLELILALPVSRPGIFLSLWVVSVMLLTLAVSGGILGTAVAMWVYPAARTVPFLQVLLIAGNLLLLMLTINACTLLISSYLRDGSRAALIASGLTLFFYLLSYLVKVWEDIAFLSPFTIFNYFQPQKLVMDKTQTGMDFLVLSGLTLILTTLAARRFVDRDIPG